MHFAQEQTAGQTNTTNINATKWQPPMQIAPIENYRQMHAVECMHAQILACMHFFCCMHACMYFLPLHAADKTRFLSLSSLWLSATAAAMLLLMLLLLLRLLMLPLLCCCCCC